MGRVVDVDEQVQVVVVGISEGGFYFLVEALFVELWGGVVSGGQCYRPKGITLSPCSFTVTFIDQ